MKVQTFISFFLDKDGNKVTFERWNQKRLSTVVSNNIALMHNNLYRVCTPGVESIAIYATPDGNTCLPEPSKVISKDEWS